MRRVATWAGMLLVVAVMVVAVLAQPLAGGGVLALAATVVIAGLIPERMLVGVAGSVGIVMFSLAPVHLVPSAVRYGELLIVSVFAVVILVRRPRVGSRLAGPALLVGYLVVTILASYSFGVGDSMFQVLTSHAIVALSFAVFGLKSTPRERRVIVGTLIAVASLQAAYAVAEIIVKPPVLWASPVPESFAWTESRLANEIIPNVLRGQGSYGHPLLLSFTLVIATAFAQEYPFKRRGARFWLTALMFVGAIAAGSRSAVLIMVAVVLFSIGSRRFRVLRGVALAAVALLFAVVSGFFASDVVERFTASGSLTHRQGILSNVPMLLAQESDRLLIGNGWIRVGDVYDLGILPPTDGFQAIDNQYVATLITSGLIGLALLVAVMVVSIVRARGALRIALMSTVAVFFVFDVLEFPATWSLLALMIGFAAAKDRGELTDPALPPVTAERAPREAARSLP
jgi:hypothetical protein